MSIMQNCSWNKIFHFLKSFSFDRLNRVFTVVEIKLNFRTNKILLSIELFEQRAKKDLLYSICYCLTVDVAFECEPSCELNFGRHIAATAELPHATTGLCYSSLILFFFLLFRLIYGASCKRQSHYNTQILNSIFRNLIIVPSKIHWILQLEKKKSETNQRRTVYATQKSTWIVYLVSFFSVSSCGVNLSKSHQIQFV